MECELDALQALAVAAAVQIIENETRRAALSRPGAKETTVMVNGRPVKRVVEL